MSGIAFYAVPGHPRLSPRAGWIPRFIADALSQPQRDELAGICATCLILSQRSDSAGQVAPRHAAGF